MKTSKLTIMNNILMIGLLIAGTFFLFRSCSAQASEWDSLTEESRFEISQFYTIKKLNASDYAFYSKLMKQHERDAVTHSENARLACWYCPKISDQEKAVFCYNSLWATLGSTPQLKFVMAIGSLLMQYGLESMKEWNYIQTNLHQAQYHFEMQQFYKELLQKA